MSCSFTEKISSLIDGELSQAEAREVERHVLSCSDCQQVRADFLSLRSQIAGYESSLEPTVQNRALKKILAPKPPKRAAAGLQWAFGAPAVAFATLLIAGAIIGLLFYQSKRASQSRTTAQVQTPAPAPSPSAEKEKQPAPEASPQSSPENQPATPNKNEKETNTPRRESPSPVK